MTSDTQGHRIENDSLGNKKIPQDVYWGIHTQRALENFVISTERVPFVLIQAIAMVKKAAALANSELGYLEQQKASGIIAACELIIQGKYQEQFPLDALQGGAGTSTNMNVNEVVANLALQHLNAPKGAYQIIHPLDHVNQHQSTNDVYPTALKIASILQIRQLSESIADLQGALQKKEKAFADILKIGRTELQEAVPISLGAEFGAFAEAIARDRWRTFKCEERLRTVNLGGTVLGTGLGAPRKYIFLVIQRLRDITGLGLTRAENPMGETAHADVFVEVSAILKAHAVNIVKIANDLRLLNAFREVCFAKRQTGSSIMPGKVNPVILEASIQTGLKVMAQDGLIADIVSRGTLQINEFLPLLSSTLLSSFHLLGNINRMLRDFIDEVEANSQQCEYYARRSLSLITAFVPFLGYQRCEELIAEYQCAGHKDLKEFLKARIDSELVEKVLDVNKIMALGFDDKEINDHG